MTNQNALEVGQAVSARSHTPAPPLACGRTLHFGFVFTVGSRQRIHTGASLP